MVIRAEEPDDAGRVAEPFVALMHFGYCPANHAHEVPEVVRVEQASSYADAAEPFMPVVESVETVDETELNQA